MVVASGFDRASELCPNLCAYESVWLESYVAYFCRTLVVDFLHTSASLSKTGWNIYSLSFWEGNQCEFVGTTPMMG